MEKETKFCMVCYFFAAAGFFVGGISMLISKSWGFGISNVAIGVVFLSLALLYLERGKKEKEEKQEEEE